jgi:integrase
MKKEPEYIKLKNYTGLYQHARTSKIQARKKIDGKLRRESFNSLREAKKWMRLYNGSVKSESDKKKTSTLKDVWEKKVDKHFPFLAISTQVQWHRRYKLLKRLEHLQMHQITPMVVTEWLSDCVKYFKSDDYNLLGRGNARRSNMRNELNMLKTIFNWYIESEYFEKESHQASLPVKKHHYEKGKIRELPIKDKAISVQDAIKLFEAFKQPFRDLAMLQFFCAARISEVAGLQWKRVDFKKRRITIMETAYWAGPSKLFQQLNPYPKNKKHRVIHFTDEIEGILKRRKKEKLKDSDFVFHFLGAPLNYCTIQSNYRSAQRKSKVSVTGTHNLRHGMATFTRRVDGSLDGVMAMTGHQDYKLADHYSSIHEEKQKEVGEKVMKQFRLEVEYYKQNKGK